MGPPPLPGPSVEHNSTDGRSGGNDGMRRIQTAPGELHLQRRTTRPHSTTDEEEERPKKKKKRSLVPQIGSSHTFIPPSRPATQDKHLRKRIPSTTPVCVGREAARRVTSEAGHFSQIQGQKTTNALYANKFGGKEKLAITGSVTSSSSLWSQSSLPGSSISAIGTKGSQQGVPKSRSGTQRRKSAISQRDVINLSDDVSIPAVVMSVSLPSAAHEVIEIFDSDEEEASTRSKNEAQPTVALQRILPRRQAPGCSSSGIAPAPFKYKEVDGCIILDSSEDDELPAIHQDPLGKSPSTPPQTSSMQKSTSNFSSSPITKQPSDVQLPRQRPSLVASPLPLNGVQMAGGPSALSEGAAVHHGAADFASQEVVTEVGVEREPSEPQTNSAIPSPTTHNANLRVDTASPVSTILNLGLNNLVLSHNPLETSAQSPTEHSKNVLSRPSIPSLGTPSLGPSDFVTWKLCGAVHDGSTGWIRGALKKRSEMQPRFRSKPSSLSLTKDNHALVSAVQSIPKGSPETPQLAPTYSVSDSNCSSGLPQVGDTPEAFEDNVPAPKLLLAQIGEPVISSQFENPEFSQAVHDTVNELSAINLACQSGERVTKVAGSESIGEQHMRPGDAQTVKVTKYMTAAPSTISPPIVRTIDLNNFRSVRSRQSHINATKRLSPTKINNASQSHRGSHADTVSSHFEQQFPLQGSMPPLPQELRKPSFPEAAPSLPARPAALVSTSELSVQETALAVGPKPRLPRRDVIRNMESLESSSSGTGISPPSPIPLISTITAPDIEMVSVETVSLEPLPWSGQTSVGPSRSVSPNTCSTGEERYSLIYPSTSSEESPEAETPDPELPVPYMPISFEGFSSRPRRSTRLSSSSVSSSAELEPEDLPRLRRWRRDPFGIRSPSDEEIIQQGGISRITRAKFSRAFEDAGFESLSWKKDRRRVAREFAPVTQSAEDIPTDLQDRLNALPPEARRASKLQAIFEAEIAANTAEDEPNAPRISIINGVDDEPTPPMEFYYTNLMWHGTDVPRPDLEALRGCSCIGPCDPNSKTCACVRRNKQFWDGGGFMYDQKGKLRHHQYPIFECNLNCGCSDECPNRVMQRGRQYEIAIQKTAAKGWGVFAGPKKIPAYSFLGVYAGEYLTDQEGEKRGLYYNSFGRTYLFDVDFFHVKKDEDDPPKYCIDAYHAGNFTRYLNHSCDPNCAIVAGYINEPNIEKPLLSIFTIRDVEPYEELCFSYFGVDEEDKPADVAAQASGAVYVPCQCGTAKCKGYLWK